MVKSRLHSRKIPWLASAAFGISLLFASEAHSQGGKWFLCLDEPAQAHFFHDSQPSDCRTRIAVKATAYITGGVNFGTRATTSDAGKFADDSHDIYLPRGTSVLLLEDRLSGKRLAYAWNTAIFFSVAAYSMSGSQRSYAWQIFDDDDADKRRGITLRKTTFENVMAAASSATTEPSSNALLSPQEIPSGRVVEMGEVGDIEGVEKQEVDWGVFTGHVNLQDVRPINRPKLDVKSKYYVGSQLVRSAVIKACDTPAPTSRGRNTSGSEPTTNVKRKVYTYGIFAEPKSWQSQLNLNGDRKDYDFVKTVYCDTKKVEVEISQGARHAVLSDGSGIVRNEEDFERNAGVLRKAGFTNDEVFFIIARALNVMR